MSDRPSYVLPIIVFAQFAGTSLWFAGNAVLADLGLDVAVIGHLTSAVQFGFICGTLVFSLLALADRFAARHLFLGCSLLGALANLAPLILGAEVAVLLGSRFVTGFFLAGIYPVGMKIAASWYARGLGRAIGYLVGALVLGTAFPHLLSALGLGLSWKWVFGVTSALAAGGGLLLAFQLGDGPHLPKASPFRFDGLVRIFRESRFRAAAFGYFGHMWELYTFWAFIPVVISLHNRLAGASLNPSISSFAIIALGVLGCVVGGRLSLVWGSAHIAAWQLACSGLCCLLSPLIITLPTPLFLVVLALWGITVIGDSPQFSALSAQTAPRELVGTALTMVTCIGFALTIVSIQVIDLVRDLLPERFLLIPLLIGPMAGLFWMRPLLARVSESRI